MVEATLPLYGDVLECILSHVPTADLLSARRVSPTWQYTAHVASRRSRRSKPWLILLLPGSCVAYDPHSRTWVALPMSRERDHRHVYSSSSNLLYDLGLYKLLLLQPPSATWTNIPAPRVWRVDPVIAAVGPTVVVAGGTSDYEDESPAHVEIFDPTTRTWEPSAEIPPELPSIATWLSVATSSTKLHMISKYTGIYASFDPSAGKWSGTCDIRPDPTAKISAIAHNGSRLLYAGLCGEHLRIHDVSSGAEIGRMTAEMTARLVGEGMGKMTTIGFGAVGEFGYVYNPTRYVEGFSFDFVEKRWESIGRPKVLDQDPLAKILFGCSTVTLEQLVNVLKEKA